MRSSRVLWGLLAGAAGIASLAALAPAETATKPSEPDWHMNATIIEACSCPMFCTCYFNSEPASHGGHDHFCRFNNAFRVNRGHFGTVNLDGAKFWVSGDLGAEFDDGEMDWAVLTFDRSLTKEQRDAIGTILGHVYPVRWKSFRTAEGTIDAWSYDADKAVATLDGGKTAEVRLRRRSESAGGPGPTVIKNLKYWAVPRNDGFVLMPNEVEAYRAGDKPFEFKGTNGFLITFDISSKDLAPAKPGS